MWLAPNVPSHRNGLLTAAGHEQSRHIGRNVVSWCCVNDRLLDSCGVDNSGWQIDIERYLCNYLLQRSVGPLGKVVGICMEQIP